MRERWNSKVFVRVSVVEGRRDVGLGGGRYGGRSDGRKEDKKDVGCSQGKGGR